MSSPFHLPGLKNALKNLCCKLFNNTKSKCLHSYGSHTNHLYQSHLSSRSLRCLNEESLFTNILQKSILGTQHSCGRIILWITLDPKPKQWIAEEQLSRLFSRTGRPCACAKSSGVLQTAIWSPSSCTDVRKTHQRKIRSKLKPPPGLRRGCVKTSLFIYKPYKTRH